MGENWSMGVYKNNVVNLCFLNVLSTTFFVYYIFFRQTFGHDLLLEEQSGAKNTFKEGLN